MQSGQLYFSYVPIIFPLRPVIFLICANHISTETSSTAALMSSRSKKTADPDSETDSGALFTFFFCFLLHNAPVVHRVRGTLCPLQPVFIITPLLYLFGQLSIGPQQVLILFRCCQSILPKHAVTNLV